MARRKRKSGTEDPDNPPEVTDESGPESAGRKKGGGKKSPGGHHQRQNKLPACSLPNNMVPTFYVGGGNGVSLVDNSLSNLGWKRITDKYDERFRLKWVECKSRINYGAFREGDQLVNHLPNSHLLTNKLGLLNSLKEYERVTLSTKGRLPRLKMSDFHPETYKLDEKTDRDLFLEVYKDGEIWICKPVGMNQGKGIFLIRSRDEIYKTLEEREQKKQLPQKPGRPIMTRIVQRYITNPLLLDGRKFDIRAYMLIASTVPYLILYHKGYVRLSCNKYDGNDMNLVTHLTNQFIQKKDPAYKELKEETAWSMDRFNDYINKQVLPNCPVEIEEDWVYNTLTKQMQKIMIHCFNSVKHKLQSRIGFFDLFGLDFMVDTDMKVWLIEVNTNPALHCNCEALKEVIPPVVEEGLYISIECFEKARKHQPLIPLQSLKNFIILYCGTHPNVITTARPSRSVSPGKDTGVSDKSKYVASVRRVSPPRPPHRVLTQSTPMFTTASNQRRLSEKSDSSPSTTLVNKPGAVASSNSAHHSLSSVQHSGKNSNSATKPTSASVYTMTAKQAANKDNKTKEETSQQENQETDKTDQSAPAKPLSAVAKPPPKEEKRRPMDTLALTNHTLEKTADSISLATSALGKISLTLDQVGLTDSLLEEVRLKMTHANQTGSSSATTRERENLERGN